MAQKANAGSDFAIINWWWADDHGAILTAYALQQFISECGYSSELLKCWCSYSEEKRLNGISNRFSSKYMNISDKVYSTYTDLFEPNNNLELNNKYTAFITGSDQVFRAEWVPDSWFLTFVNGKGKIAAAASFGTNEFNCPDTDRYNRIRSSIRSFDYLSVREDDGIMLCKKHFDTQAKHILDPVFLPDVNIYNRIIDSKTEQGNYIFCYIRDINDNITAMINRIAKKYSLDVIYCSENMDVDQFILYLSKSQYVITDSYHGLCFSIIYNKTYLCVLNQMRGKSRFESLSRQLHLPDTNFLNDNEIQNRNSIKKIDYEQIQVLLNKNIEFSRQSLKKALEDTYNKYKMN